MEGSLGAGAAETGEAFPFPKARPRVATQAEAWLRSTWSGVSSKAGTCDLVGARRDGKSWCAHVPTRPLSEEPTAVTGPCEECMKILVFPHHDDRWRWLLHGVDGVPVAVSGGSFSTHAQAMRHAQAALVCLRDAPFEEDGYIAIPGPEHLEGSMLRR
ncbi:hypothetical protein [Variovorax boronicumulans]|uniref:hypothetical protein n=1 Tax=Variovorax boronicumulans TaxID=436515 RepID=UPI001C584DEF